MNAITEWWNGLEARERRMLIAGGIALAIILYVFVIWLPAHRQAEALEERLAQQRTLLAWMKEAAAEAQQLKAAGLSPQAAAAGQNLFSVVDQSARQAGLANAVRQVKPEEGKVRVSLQQASFDAMMRWLATLKTRYAVEASLLSVRGGNVPGTVDAQLVLEGAAQ